MQTMTHSTHRTPFTTSTSSTNLHHKPIYICTALCMTLLRCACGLEVLIVAVFSFRSATLAPHTTNTPRDPNVCTQNIASQVRNKPHSPATANNQRAICTGAVTKMAGSIKRAGLIDLP